MIPILEVRHSHGAYPVLRVTLADVLKAVGDHFTVTDANVARALQLSGQRQLTVRPGEQSKSFGVYRRVLRAMAAKQLKRNEKVFAVGGGVVGDLAGFAAASYMRGVAVVQVPTSLLAMVDSSVGGKVGIDLPEGKNLVGAFHQPQAVWIVPEALQSLPKRHIRNGLAEVLKYGFILDPSMIELAGDAITTGDWTAVVSCSIKLKAQVVQEDEFETTGRRAILNFGHTVGHAIEAEMGYRHLLHGEAVSIGMVAEAKLGERLGVTPSGTAKQVEETLTLFGLPTQIPTPLDPEKLRHRMGLDKKVEGDGLAFSLLTAFGECKLCRGVDPAALQTILARP